jgi:hypothetical protein
MDLDKEKITPEEIEEIMEMESVMKAERVDFEQEVHDWMTMEQILYNHNGVLFEAEREEPYAYKKNIAFDYLMGR